MILNERIKAIREYRRLQGRKLAAKAGISASELSLIESQARSPKLDTLQKLAAALDVSVAYLIGDEDEKLDLPKALAYQSLKLFVKRNPTSHYEKRRLDGIANLVSAPKSEQEWKDFVANFRYMRQ